MNGLLTLTRFQNNPIITPRDGQGWESGGTFNPGAVVVDDVIHLLYRGVDKTGTSRLGHATSRDGGMIAERLPTPVLQPTAQWEEFGCEDPRISRMNGLFYVTYTAYSQRGPRIALASTSDFSHFKKYGVIGPDVHDKDCVLFPEKVNGKIALLHRIDGRIQIAYFDDAQSLTNPVAYWERYLKDLARHEVIRPKYHWETRKIGAGPPPIRTKEGWLVIYHGVSAERVYRAGAFLLDLKDPQQVIARSRAPILEPETEFEKRGVVPNVVFPEGAVVRDGELVVYYGGADRVCCAAKVSLDEFLEELEQQTLIPA